MVLSVGMLVLGLVFGGAAVGIIVRDYYAAKTNTAVGEAWHTGYREGRAAERARQVCLPN